MGGLDKTATSIVGQHDPEWSISGPASERDDSVVNPDMVHDLETDNEATTRRRQAMKRLLADSVHAHIDIVNPLWESQSNTRSRVIRS